MTGNGAPLRVQWCNQGDGCATRVIVALRADTSRWVSYEAEERDPASQASVGCHVLVGRQAWKPAALAEHFRVQFEISEDAAEALVKDYPHHRPHIHLADGDD